MSEVKTKKLCVVSCPIATRSGYGSRSRDFVRALIKVRPDWDVKILSQRWGNTPMTALKQGEDDDLLIRIVRTQLTQKPDVWIQITVPNEFQPIGNFNIGVTAGVETTIMPSDCLDGANKMDLIIGSSEFTKLVFEKTTFDKKDNNTQQKIGELKLEKPVEVLFEGLNLDIFDEKKPISPRISKILSKVEEDFAFLFVGHWLNGDFGEDRKNVSGLIWTFLNTFKGKKTAPALILKTNGANTSVPDRVRIKGMIDKIKEQFKDELYLPNIYLIHDELTNEELNSLYNHPKVKAHVSFTHGEGFGRPLLEATISGKPILASAWSGHVDFLHPEHHISLAGNLKPVHKSASNKFLMKEAQWFGVDYNTAGLYMKDVYSDYDKYLAASRKSRKYTKDNFSLEKMAERLDSILSNMANIKPTPTVSQIKMPKLKKAESASQPTMKMPKLKKVTSG